MIRHTCCLVARGKDPFRNLAIEKHLMDTLPEDTAILYLWQNDRSVILGRSQNPYYECMVNEFLEEGGQIARRLSGGRAVYQDAGTLNFSLIVPKADFDLMRQYELLRAALASFGLEAWLGNGTELLIGDRKCCDNAYYKSGSTACHFGTLLFDTDIGTMARYMTGEDDSRVINLRTFLPELSMDDLEIALYQSFGRAYRHRPAVLDEMLYDRKTLAQLTEQFADLGWIYPEARPYGFSIDEHLPWGSVTVKMQVDGGVIRYAKIFTDAMEAGLFGMIEDGLKGCPYLISAISSRLRQKLELLRDPQLLQIAGDVITLICGRIRMLDRSASTLSRDDK